MPILRIMLDMTRRLLQLYAGLILYGASLALQIRAWLGLDPWDVFHQGLSEKTGLSFGTIVIIIGALVLLAWIPLRQKPGIGTISNVFVVGLAVDATLAILPEVARPRAPAPAARGGHLPQRRRRRGLHRRGPRPGPARRPDDRPRADHGQPVGVVRTSLEVGVLAAGIVLGGTVGLGTVLYALSIGPLLQVLLPAFTIREPVPATA